MPHLFYLVHAELRNKISKTPDNDILIYELSNDAYTTWLAAQNVLVLQYRNVCTIYNVASALFSVCGFHLPSSRLHSNMYFINPPTGYRSRQWCR